MLMHINLRHCQNVIFGDNNLIIIIIIILLPLLLLLLKIIVVVILIYIAPFLTMLQSASLKEHTNMQVKEAHINDHVKSFNKNRICFFFSSLSVTRAFNSIV